MPDMGAGTKLYHFGYGVATLNLSPLVPNAAIVRRISLGAASGSDTWVIRTNGQEVGRFKTISGGLQNCLQGFRDMFDVNYDIFDYCREVLGFDLLYPIPEGKTLTIASEGGATADIAIEYEEFAPSALNPSLVNYPGGNYWVNPVWFSVAAHPTVAGEAAIDTEVGLDFVPTLFVKESFPQGWTARILELFLTPLGVNTYSGSADNLSRTDYLAAIRSGQRLFTRDGLGGIPLHGIDANTGSANVTNGPAVSPSVQIDLAEARDKPFLTEPIMYRPGYVYDWRLGISGSLTGGANYSTALQLAIVEYRSS